MHPSDKGHAELAKRLLQAWECMPLSPKVEGKAGYQLIKTISPANQVKTIHRVCRQKIEKIINEFKAFRARAIVSGHFDVNAFREQMEKTFFKYGYRQVFLGKQTEILIITDSGIGDFINLSPCLREIRRIYSDL